MEGFKCEWQAKAEGFLFEALYEGAPRPTEKSVRKYLLTQLYTSVGV